MSTTVWFVLVIAFACFCLTISLGFLGAALERNRGRLEQAEEIRRMLANVRAGQH